MNDDELLAAAHEAVKEKDPLVDARWDALARGELTEEESDALPFDPRARAVFEKIDAETIERLLFERLSRKSNVVPFRRFRAWAATATVLAAAAMALFFFRPREGAMLPAYEMTVQGEKLERSGEPGTGTPIRLGPGSRVEIILRPETPLKSSVMARVFLVRGGSARKLDVSIERSDEGVLRIVGSFDDVFRGVAAGAAEIIAAIGVQERLPGENDVLRVESRREGVQIVRTPIWIVER